jgi:hypothetical protein
MQLFINYSILVAAVWLIGMAQITKTDGIHAALVFRGIPMFLGLACLFDALKLFGWI